MLAGLKDFCAKMLKGSGGKSPFPTELHPSLVEALDHAGMRCDGFRLGVDEETVRSRLPFPDRSLLFLVADGESKAAEWRVPSLRALFRGEAKVPSDVELRDGVPPHYVPFIHTIESHVLTFGTIGRTPTDMEFVEVYSAMRRRPDGSSSGVLHDLAWQAAVFELGLRPWSGDEYAALFKRLEQSAKTFNMGRGSQNYATYVKGCGMNAY